MSSQKYKIPDSELDVLKVLWEKGPSTASQIREQIQSIKKTELAHPTIVSFIQRLEQKGYVQKTDQRIGKAFVYDAAIQPEKVRKHSIQTTMKRWFGDDMVPVISQLIESSSLTKEEIAQIRQTLDQQEKRKKEKDHD